MLSRKHDCADHGDGVKRVGQRHERRVKQWRDAADDFESDETRQHKNVQAIDNIRHGAPYNPDYPGVTSSGREKNFRTRAFTTSPRCVNRVSRMISSEESSWS